MHHCALILLHKKEPISDKINTVNKKKEKTMFQLLSRTEMWINYNTKHKI